jgi:hypothetical protein
MMRLVTYLQAVRRWMDPEEFMGIKQLPIFACAAGAEAESAVASTRSIAQTHSIVTSGCRS